MTDTATVTKKCVGWAIEEYLTVKGSDRPLSKLVGEQGEVGRRVLRAECLVTEMVNRLGEVIGKLVTGLEP